jgi:DNA-binding PadR family transcriptional regulator
VKIHDQRYQGYHTLANADVLESSLRMTKEEILAIFSRSTGFLSPDEVRVNLRPEPNRRSFYSYLLRLASQGLLERRSAGRGSLAYRLTDRGRARLGYLRNRKT